jgi:hypothetical protein
LIYRKEIELTRIPTIIPDSQAQPVNPNSPSKIEPTGVRKETRNKGKKGKNQSRYALAPTFDIPLGRSKTSAKMTSPAVKTTRKTTPQSQPQIPNPTNAHRTADTI